MLGPLLLLALVDALPRAGAAPHAQVQCLVSDAQGQPAAGATVDVYRGANTRRAADYISPTTGSDGTCRLALPPGRYWLVARHRRGARLGPLRPGDRHSGTPLVVDLAAGTTTRLAFAIRDPRDAVLLPRTRADHVSVEGQVTERGRPLAHRSVCAWRGELAPPIPEFVSAWTGPDGRYRLTLPAGGYSLAVTTHFPPDGPLPAQRRVEITGNTVGLDLALDGAGGHGG